MSNTSHFEQDNTDLEFQSEEINQEQGSGLKMEDETITQCDQKSTYGGTRLTIQLPDSMQGNAVSQQKIQELIMQLSQSGQLRDESKIIIEVKTAPKMVNTNSQSEINETHIGIAQPAIRYVPVQQSQHLQKTTFVRALSGNSQSNGSAIKMAVLQNHSCSLQQSQQISVSSAALQGYQISSSGALTSGTANSQQQQPAYIIIPTSQLGSGNQLQVSQNNAQSIQTPTSSPLRVINQAGQHIILQQGNNLKSSSAITSTPISSFSLKSATLGGERSVVVLQQQHHTPAPIVSVRQLAAPGGGQQHHTMASGGSSNLNHALASRLSQVVDSSSLSHCSPQSSLNASNSSVSSMGRMSRDGLSGPGGRESSWQQYVKQFEKLGPCPICGDKISGYHYGIFCCESCKGFFKRTVQNAKRYACHMSTPSSLCDITATSRKKCPACRFVKCLEKGMRMEAIRSDRTRGGRSMYPGSRYLRQLAARASGSGNDRSSNVLPAIAPLPNNDATAAGVNAVLQQVMPITLGPHGLPASEDVGGGVYLDPAVLEDSAGGSTIGGQSNSFHDDDYKGSGLGALLTRPQNQLELPKLLRDIIKVEESVEAEPEERLDFDTSNNADAGSGQLPANVTEEEAAVYRALLNLADQRLYRIVRWSRALPVFNNLDTDDQILLLQNCWADLLCLDCCWKSLPTPTEIRLTSSKCINLDAAREMGAEALVDSLLRLTQDLKRLRLSLVDFACLKVCLLMQPDLTNLRAVRSVKHFQECVSQMLMDYNASEHPDLPNKFSELLVHIPELQTTSSMARNLLADKDLSPYLSANSLLMELLRSDFHRHPSSMMTGIMPQQHPQTDNQAVAMETSSGVFASPSVPSNIHSQNSRSSSGDDGVDGANPSYHHQQQGDETFSSNGLGTI